MCFHSVDLIVETFLTWIKQKRFYQLIWGYGQEGTFILTTVLVYPSKPPEISADLLLLTCSPNDFLLPDAIEWGTSIGKRDNKHKNTSKHWWKEGIKGMFFLCYIFFPEHSQLETQLTEDRLAKLPWSWQVATRLIPTSPLCKGDAYQKSLLIGGYGKNRYKSAEVLCANACIQC